MTSQVGAAVTLICCTYNQERYVQAAVESVLKQDLEPREIIFSDDASTDKTFKILESVVAGYRGTASIRVLRNEHNMGIIPHVNKLMELVKGEFVIAFAGDDVSDPQRARLLADCWERSGRSACSIFTNAMVIDESGTELGPYYAHAPVFSRSVQDFISGVPCWVGGFSHGWSTELFRKFGPITKDTFQEDGAIAFRALLNGGIHYLDQVTMRYRRHDANSYDLRNRRKFKLLHASELGLLRGRKADLLASNSLDAADRLALTARLDRQHRRKTWLVKTPGLLDALFLLKWMKARLVGR